MMEKIIFGAIEYSPKIWGLSYKNLFITIFVSFATIWIVSSQGLLAGFATGVAVGAGAYGALYKLDNRDSVESSGNGLGIRNLITGFDMCDQEIIIK